MEVSKSDLKKYANKLMFDMEDSEYDTLSLEFKVILKQMDFIGNIKDIDKVEPMFFPFKNENATLREDEVIENNTLTVDEVLSNSKSVLKDQTKVPKVVE